MESFNGYRRGYNGFPVSKYETSLDKGMGIRFNIFQYSVVFTHNRTLYCLSNNLTSSMHQLFYKLLEILQIIWEILFLVNYWRFMEKLCFSFYLFWIQLFFIVGTSLDLTCIGFCTQTFTICSEFLITLRLLLLYVTLSFMFSLQKTPQLTIIVRIPFNNKK